MTQLHFWPDEAPAEPVLTWLGGKRRALRQIWRRLPQDPPVRQYWEPFFGAGAVWLGLRPGRLKPVLSDLNRELIVTHAAIRDRPEDVIALLRDHERAHEMDAGREHYHAVRRAMPLVDLDEAGTAARMIYLNAAAISSVYRVNSEGRFNVAPATKAKAICRPDRIRRASEALQGACLAVGDFERIVEPEPGDLVYCDPPYHASHTRYHARSFGPDDQRRLRDAAIAWADRGGRVLLSNGDTPEMRRLYAGPRFRVEIIRVLQTVNFVPGSAGYRTELLISTCGA